MLTRERKALIQKILRRDGRLIAKTFSKEIGVSEDTIRRDLRELAGDGLLQRV
ncbi:DeoR family transcriptional regulator, partial [Staphylococcus aureus]